MIKASIFHLQSNYKGLVYKNQISPFESFTLELLRRRVCSSGKISQEPMSPITSSGVISSTCAFNRTRTDWIKWRLTVHLDLFEFVFGVCVRRNVHRDAYTAWTDVVEIHSKLPSNHNPGHFRPPHRNTDIVCSSSVLIRFGHRKPHKIAYQFAISHHNIIIFMKNRIENVRLNSKRQRTSDTQLILRFLLSFYISMST